MKKTAKQLKKSVRTSAETKARLKAFILQTKNKPIECMVNEIEQIWEQADKGYALTQSLVESIAHKKMNDMYNDTGKRVYIWRGRESITDDIINDVWAEFLSLSEDSQTALLLAHMNYRYKVIELEVDKDTYNTLYPMASELKDTRNTLYKVAAKTSSRYGEHNTLKRVNNKIVKDENGNTVYSMAWNSMEALTEAERKNVVTRYSVQSLSDYGYIESYLDFFGFLEEFGRPSDIEVFKDLVIGMPLKTVAIKHNRNYSALSRRVGQIQKQFKEWTHEQGEFTYYITHRNR